MSWTGQKILIGSYSPGAIPGVITEVDLLPVAGDLTTIATVLQQKGCSRRRVKGKIYVVSVAAYEAYVTDYLAGTTGSLDDVTGTFAIEDIGEPNYVQDDCVFFDCTWIEV